MKQPTEEQIKELWEWCGFIPFKNRPKSGLPYSWDGWELPDSIFEVSKLPSIDLNNLFEYAVPRMEEIPLGKQRCILLGWMSEVVTNKVDPALALFWAIFNVLKEK